MTRCNVTVTARPIHTGTKRGFPWEEMQQETVVRCITHGMDMDAQPGVGIATLCPVGKIEEATEKALKEIEEAKR